MRFQRTIAITRHAQVRMDERRIDTILLLGVIDSGETRYRDATHLWVFKDFIERSDNLLCAVLVLEGGAGEGAGDIRLRGLEGFRKFRGFRKR